MVMTISNPEPGLQDAYERKIQEKKEIESIQPEVL
mgnify:FL=1|jgi:hypothetical protein|tara:strand:+ start:721 stop:825 length:105 start_codon:yes stop_codon:yes gene_type:complete